MVTVLHESLAGAIYATNGCTFVFLAPLVRVLWDSVPRIPSFLNLSARASRNFGDSIPKISGGSGSAVDFALVPCSKPLNRRKPQQRAPGPCSKPIEFDGFKTGIINGFPYRKATHCAAFPDYPPTRFASSSWGTISVGYIS